MVIKCFDIGSCVNAFLEPSSVLLQKEDEQEENEVFLSSEPENHMPALAQDAEELGGWEECSGVSLLLSARSGGPRSAVSCGGFSSCSQTPG